MNSVLLGLILLVLVLHFIADMYVLRIVLDTKRRNTAWMKLHLVLQAKRRRELGTYELKLYDALAEEVTK